MPEGRHGLPGVRGQGPRRPRFQGSHFLLGETRPWGSSARPSPRAAGSPGGPGRFGRLHLHRGARRSGSEKPRRLSHPEDGDPNYPAETGFPAGFKGFGACSKSVPSRFSSTPASAARTGRAPLLASARPLVNRVAPIGGTLPPHVTLLAAAQEDQVSSGYGAGRHGLFSYFLLKGLRGAADADRDRTITAGELRDFVRDGVTRAASGMDREQTPVLFGDPSRPISILPRSKMP